MYCMDIGLLDLLGIGSYQHLQDGPASDFQFSCIKFGCFSQITHVARLFLLMEKNPAYLQIFHLFLTESSQLLKFPERSCRLLDDKQKLHVSERVWS